MDKNILSRVRIITDRIVSNSKSVIYIMSREQRVQGNYSLFYAKQLAAEKKLPLLVIFIFYTSSSSRLLSHFTFMAKGLEEVAQELQDLNIPFIIQQGSRVEVIKKLVSEYRPSHLIFDYSPLRSHKNVLLQLKNLECTIHEVDARNIVPVWEVSSKQEWAAYSLRPKLHRLFSSYTEKVNPIEAQSQSIIVNESLSLSDVIKNLKVTDYPQNFIVKPGRKVAINTLNEFVNNKLQKYDELRNNPTEDGQSNLSAYLHFGQISSLEVVQKVIETYGDFEKMPNFAKAFVEEIFVRRELAENFVYYNENYDNELGIPEWARKTLDKHLTDKREYVYSQSDFENANTHDDAWNAAQLQMMKIGKMHGYMRMYWVKKILEWTNHYRDALSIAIYLNDKYELDGADPNGYTGILWGIGGLHDRPWQERNIFGNVRYMNYEGLKRKFDVFRYIQRWKSIST